jgi:hypothetical protein
LTYFNEAKSGLFRTKWLDSSRFSDVLREQARIKTSASLYVAGQGARPSFNPSARIIETT